MDIIDVQVAVNPLKSEEITQASTGEISKSVRARVQTARDIATNRFQ
jgi:magnesium chelatase family protein